jgi:hypothetical protein
MSTFSTSVVYHTTKLQPQTSRLLQRDMFAQNPSNCRNTSHIAIIRSISLYSIFLMA